MLKNSKIVLFGLGATLIFFIVALFLFFTKNNDIVFAQTNTKDAIAIRIIPNVEHYSAMRWYKNQKFTGSPQSLLVDGYSAVRDGRTVYVNVANVSSGDNSIYTNIYLITYNQEAEKTTQDIFGNVIKNWKFNTNVSDRGHCRNSNSIICALDDECSIGDFCDSLKSLIIRDTRRLEDLAEIKIGLNSYFTRDYYPRLSAGTYLPGKSLSVWPSWQEQFRTELGLSLPKDPVNQLGKCCPAGAGFICTPGDKYNPKTCWDENKKIFSTNLPGTLPDSSLVYAYNTNNIGSIYNLCAVLESGLTIGGNQLIENSCPKPCIDMDYDGYGLFANNACAHSTADCDDTNAAVFGGGAEICNNNIDDDCDGLMDCFDADCALSAVCIVTSVCTINNVCEAGESCANCPADCCCGDGSCNNATECPGKTYACPIDCKCGNGRIDCGEECDGGLGCNSDCTLAVSVCTDADKDRYIKEATPIASCGNICGIGNEACLGNNDCNDNNANINPGKSEICDGLDNNCNGQIDEGLTAETCGNVCVALGYNYNASRGGALRCCGNDAKEAGPYEASETSCADGRDNDCDGTFDNSTVNPASPDTDCLVCSAGNSLSENFWYLFALFPDCNQCDHDGDDDGDQFSEDWSAYSGMADKCDSDCGTVAVNVPRNKYENNNEITCDGIDNDCDGQIDEGLKITYYIDNDGDTFGNAGVYGDYCSINKPANYVANNSDCNDANASIKPSAVETCGNSVDDNCDGNVDEGCVMNTYCKDMDKDGFGDPATIVSAAVSPGGDYISDCTDCNDSSAFAKPGGTETCDGLDNNCLNGIDEGCDDDGDDYCDVIMKFYNFPLAVCPNTNLVNGSDGDDCDDANPARYPGNTEICDSIDNDCTSATADGSGEVFYEAGTELTCNDNEDNDCDGNIDGADSDCPNFCTFDFILPCVLQ